MIGFGQISGASQRATGRSVIRTVARPTELTWRRD
jgi:hypothetical protein